MKKIISIIITAAVLLSAMSVGVFAVNLHLTTTQFTLNGRSILLSNSKLEEAIDITAEEAEYIAELFLDDMILLDDCAWDENTEIVDIITMYDETGLAPTAYTVELTTGYIVVSAFADTESLIPEWSDIDEPIYNDFSESDTILYLGSLEYYADAGNDTVIDSYGHDIERNKLINHIEYSRDISNLSDESIGICSVVMPDIPPSMPVIQIEDPYAEARRMYNDNFVCVDYCNLWDDGVNYNYIEYFESSDIENSTLYRGPCFLVCVTNMVIAHSEKYNIPLTSYDSSIHDNNDLFEFIARLGIDNDYYIYDQENGYYSGVRPNKFREYIYKVMSELSIDGTCAGNILPTYDNVRSHLTSGSLLALYMDNHPAYNFSNTVNAHEVLCFAYVRLRGQTTGYYKTYLKVADGLNDSARFIDLSTIVDYENGEYVANGHSSYVRVTFTE